jgi:uncharacterized HAD superfamily protein
MNIASDLDACVMDVYEIIRQGILKKYNIDFPKEKQTQFKFHIPNLDGMETANFIVNILKENHNKIKPVYGSIDTLRYTYKVTKNPIVFITARSEYIRKETNEWLEKYCDFPYKLIMTNYKSKHEILQENNIDIFIDDRYKTVIECADYVNKIFLLSYPWNENRHIPDNIFRVSSMTSILFHLDKWKI